LCDLAVDLSFLYQTSVPLYERNGVVGRWESPIGGGMLG